MFSSCCPFIFPSLPPPGRAKRPGEGQIPPSFFARLTVVGRRGQTQRCSPASQFCGFHTPTINCKNMRSPVFLGCQLALQPSFQLNPHCNWKIFSAALALFSLLFSTFISSFLPSIKEWPLNFRAVRGGLSARKLSVCTLIIYCFN